mmetsp:Transcript_35819/g.80139  ORF Transcript_35819/g.80139 Transcript_35819/m.80139 type:complete len:221 (+) Transcript_35819:2-664(+)
MLRSHFGSRAAWRRKRGFDLMEQPPRMTSTIMVDQQASEDRLRSIEEKLIEMRESSIQQMPLVFFCIAGSPHHPKHSDVSEATADLWIRVVRRMLDLRQPIYGIATGNMNSFGIMLLEACDCVFTDTLQEGVHANRILRPLEMAFVCRVAAEEAKRMDAQELASLKAKLVRDKLFARFPKLSESARGGQQHPVCTHDPSTGCQAEASKSLVWGGKVVEPT